MNYWLIYCLRLSHFSNWFASGPLTPVVSKKDRIDEQCPQTGTYRSSKIKWNIRRRTTTVSHRPESYRDFGRDMPRYMAYLYLICFGYHCSSKFGFQRQFSVTNQPTKKKKRPGGLKPGSFYSVWYIVRAPNIFRADSSFTRQTKAKIFRTSTYSRALWSIQ